MLNFYSKLVTQFIDSFITLWAAGQVRDPLHYRLSIFSPYTIRSEGQRDKPFRKLRLRHLDHPGRYLVARQLVDTASACDEASPL